MISYNSEEPLFSIHIPKSGGTSLVSILEFWFNKSTAIRINNHPRLYKLLVPLNLDFTLQHFRKCGLYYHYRNEIANTVPRKVPLGYKYGFFLNKHIPECIHGHFDPQTDEGNLFFYYPKATQLITFLRDPLEMQISLFYYMKQRIEEGGMFWAGNLITEMKYDGDIDRWVEERDLFMLRFFPFDINETNYDMIINNYFVHIGITENMQQSINIMADKLSFKTVNVLLENSTPRYGSPSESSIKVFKEKHKLEYKIYELASILNQ